MMDFQKTVTQQDDDAFLVTDSTMDKLDGSNQALKVEVHQSKK